MVTRGSITTTVVLCAWATLVGVAAAAPPRKPPAVKDRGTAGSSRNDVTFTSQIRPLVQRYCISCHGPQLHSGEVSFHTFRTDADVLKGRDLWEKASRRLASHQMPPRNAAQPTTAERSLLVNWIDARLSSAECLVRDPGRVTLRRLNRVEYNNTVRDLFGADFRLADDFPSDDVGYGFDNIGDVLSLSPILMEKYLTAAERIVREVIRTPEPPDPFSHQEAERLETDGATAVVGAGFRGLYSNGEVRATVSAPEKGAYLIRARAYGQQAGPDPVRMEVQVNNRSVRTFEVRAVQSRPEEYEVVVELAAGRHTLSVMYTNDFFDRSIQDQEKRDRNFFLDYVEVAGPVFVAGTEPPALHRKLIPARPAPGAEDTAASDILKGFARRAYRRPVSAAEVEALVNHVRLARKEGESFERGIQLALQAVLVSPNFLFRVELDPVGGSGGKSYPLGDFELASRLSYFLWSSMPDDELLGIAEKGDLKKPEILEAQAERLLRDARSQALVENFATQWLTLRNLKAASPDPKRFPGFNDALRGDMMKETELFFQSIMREDRSVLDLLGAKYTFLNERLARHYGIKWVQGEQFRRVQLQPGDHRSGILTHGSILTVTSNPTRTSPVKRGKWVLEQLLGTPPPAPPPNVPELKADEGQMLTGTLRQKMEQHRTNPMCASCHTQMDAIGFGLENFDAVGAWRTNEGQFPVDASGTLPGGESFRGPEELVQILKNRKQDVARAFAEQLLTYALGRGLQYTDRCEVRELTRSVASRGYRFSALISEIVTSDPFRMRKGEGTSQ